MNDFCSIALDTKVVLGLATFLFTFLATFLLSEIGLDLYIQKLIEVKSYDWVCNPEKISRIKYIYPNFSVRYI